MFEARHFEPKIINDSKSSTGNAADCSELPRWWQWNRR